jgi:hypothetical protein
LQAQKEIICKDGYTMLESTMAETKSIQSKGGEARARALTREERSDIARTAALARHDKGRTILKATHEGPLELGGVEIDCAVLEDGTRVLSRAGFVRAIGRTGKVKGGEAYKPESNLPVFLGAENLNSFISSDLVRNSTPLHYKPLRGGVAMGYQAELLAAVCEVFLTARAAGALAKNQFHIATQCELLMRGFARVGITALVDEATGFQYDRPRKDLEQQLAKFLSESLRRWVRTFPAEYFKHLCRLRGVELRPDMKLPQYFGKLTNNLVYRRLAPGLLRKLKERREERGSRSNKLHSWLSEDVGLRGVLVHLGTVVGFMKLHTDYEKFERQLDLVAPIYPETPGLFDNPKDWEEPA